MSNHGGSDIHNLEYLIEDFSTTTNFMKASIKGINNIINNINDINYYPNHTFEPFKSDLVNFLYKDLNKKNNNLLFGNGASELIELIIRINCNNNNYLNYYVPDIQYCEYEINCINNNLKKTEIENADIICIVNPCNPSGIYYNLNELVDIINKCKKNSIIIIDESMQLWYGSDFRNNSLLSLFDYINKKSIDDNINIYLLHSWTKFFSCTGLRIGSVLCPSDNSYNLIKNNLIPWNCNILALKYLQAAIKDDEYINNTWNNTNKIKNKQINILKNKFNNWVFEGVDFIPWIWIKIPTNDIAERLYNISKKSGMPIRWGKSGYNKNNYIRIGIRDTNKFNLLVNLWENELKK